MKFLIWLLLLSGTGPLLAQQSLYLPQDSAALFAELSQRSLRALVEVPAAHRPFFEESLLARDSMLRSAIRDSVYLFDRDLQPYLEGLFRRIADENGLELEPIVLLEQDWSPNAKSLGEGIFAVHLGLLRQLTTEEELLFVLCHEVAHDRLDHRRVRLLDYAERHHDLTPTMRKLYRYAPLRSKRRHRRLVEDYRDHTYAGFRLQRTAELQADSLALVYFGRMGYPAGFAASALRADEVVAPDTLPEHLLTDLLRTEAYPIRESWLRPPPQLFGGGSFGSEQQRDTSNYFWQNDSLDTHPALADRRLRMTAYVETRPAEDTLQRGHDHPWVDSVAPALIRAHLLRDEYGLALVSALRLQYHRPDANWLREPIAAALLGVYRSAENHDFDEVVPPPGIFADGASRAVVRMLQQMRQSELRQLTLAYLQQYTPAAYAEVIPTLAHPSE